MSSPNPSKNNLTKSMPIKRILTLIKYYQMLKVNTDKDDQNIFINFINTIYTVKDIVMDYYKLQKEYGDKTEEIMKIAKSVYKIQAYDIKTCPHSSRLYRADDQAAKLNIFDKEDKESVFRVVMDIIDGIYNFIFHAFDSGLRVRSDDKSDNDLFDDDYDDKQENNEYYDIDYAKMSAKISKTRDNTARFDRINASNKFNINIDGDDNNNTDDTIDNTSDGITWLDSIYMNLNKADVDETVINKLANYVQTESFDTVGMEIDFEIENGGNIENNIDDKTCIDIIKTMFNKANSYVCIMYILYVFVHIII